MAEDIDGLREWVREANEEALYAEGFEAAIVGIAERCSEPALVVYDADRCIEILIERDGMSWEEACEFFSVNVLGSWVGKHTPLFLRRFGQEVMDDLAAVDLGEHSVG